MTFLCEVYKYSSILSPIEQIRSQSVMLKKNFDSSNNFSWRKCSAELITNSQMFASVSKLFFFAKYTDTFAVLLLIAKWREGRKRLIDLEIGRVI